MYQSKIGNIVLHRNEENYDYNKYYGIETYINQQTKQTFIVKKIKTISYTQNNLLKRDLEIQKNLQHQNVLKIIYHQLKKNTFYIILESAKPFSLYYKQNWQKQEMLSYLKQIIKGYFALRKISFRKRQFSYKNIFIKDSTIKILDIGIQENGIMEKKSNFIQSSIWSLGILLYQIFLTNPILQKHSFQTILLNIQQHTKIAEHKDIMNIIKFMIEPNINYRCSWKNLKEIIQDVKQENQQSQKQKKIKIHPTIKPTPRLTNPNNNNNSNTLKYMFHSTHCMLNESSFNNQLINYRNSANSINLERWIGSKNSIEKYDPKFIEFKNFVDPKSAKARNFIHTQYNNKRQNNNTRTKKRSSFFEYCRRTHAFEKEKKRKMKYRNSRNNQQLKSSRIFNTSNPPRITINDHQVSIDVLEQYFRKIALIDKEKESKQNGKFKSNANILPNEINLNFSQILNESELLGQRNEYTTYQGNRNIKSGINLSHKNNNNPNYHLITNKQLINYKQNYETDINKTKEKKISKDIQNKAKKSHQITVKVNEDQLQEVILNPKENQKMSSHENKSMYYINTKNTKQNKEIDINEIENIYKQEKQVKKQLNYVTKKNKYKTKKIENENIESKSIQSKQIPKNNALDQNIQKNQKSQKKKKKQKKQQKIDTTEKNILNQPKQFKQKINLSPIQINNNDNKDQSVDQVLIQSFKHQFQSFISKYNILGQALKFAKKYLKNQMQCWLIPCFMIYKSYYLIRKLIHQSLVNGNQKLHQLLPAIKQTNAIKKLAKYIYSKNEQIKQGIQNMIKLIKSNNDAFQLYKNAKCLVHNKIQVNYRKEYLSTISQHFMHFSQVIIQEKESFTQQGSINNLLKYTFIISQCIHLIYQQISMSKTKQYFSMNQYKKTLKLLQDRKIKVNKKLQLLQVQKKAIQQLLLK